MTWTYDSTDLSTDLAKVRLLIGDTDTSHQQLSDEEINVVLALEENIYIAAASCARVLAAKYTRMADKWVGDLKVLYSQRSRQYERLAESLAKRKGRTHQVPTAGGISVSAKESAEANTDRPTSYFRVGNMDNDE